MVRFVNSGTEATMSAIRVARALHRPREDRQVRGLLPRPRRRPAGQGRLRRRDALAARQRRRARVATPPRRWSRRTTISTALEALFEPPRRRDRRRHRRAGRREHGRRAAGAGFLEALRALAATHGALLIFDEVITGFRLGLGGAQELCGVMPDLTCLGKIIGGGMPVGAYGGRREIMEMVAPLGPVYQAGTLSGNPLAMAAGIATLRGAAAAWLLRDTRGQDGPDN